MAVLDFEKNIEALTNKIEDLKRLAKEQDLDLNDEILMMEQKLVNMEKEVYSNLDAWEKLTLVRRGERPSGYDYIQRIFTNFIEFHGDRAFGDDASIAGGIAYLDNMPVTVIAQVKGKNTKEKIKRNFGQPNPEGYRKALRLMKQAEKFKRPVICFVDTPGAFCGVGAEERGQGEAIARNLMTMSSLKTPIISILIGEGGSGGALALAVADKVCMLEHSIYSILSPEGFASILWRDGSRAKEAANIMKITAQDLFELGIIDEIINEPLGGAHRDVDKTAENMKNTITRNLDSLNNLTVTQLIEERYSKFRKMGKFIE